METASEPHRDDSVALPGLTDLELTTPGAAAVAEPVVDAPPVRRDRRARERSPSRPRPRVARLSVAARRELLWITVIYLAARGLLLLCAYLNGRYQHYNFLGQLAHWDGLWYRSVANNGYPHHVSWGQTNLGFFPLFPLMIWLLTPVFTVLTVHNQIWASTVAGLLISGTGGLVATVFVHRLAEGWFDRAAARRATVLFVVFPGSVVFSMVYSEGVLLPLVAICIWALERRRWWVAGACGAFASAVQPVGLAVPAMCACVSLLMLWRHGWRARDFWRSVAATAMSVTGAVGFAIFLWIWTGNPMANFIAQHHGWGEKTEALALVHTAKRMAPAFDPNHFNHPTINLNLLFGLVGAFIMLLQLVLIWVYRRRISLPATVWTLAITFLGFTSTYVPPNPRMMITAFPGLILIARRVQGGWFAFMISANIVALAALSTITFYGHMMRP